MDCWIASFPRSGNTYFRNILYYVYGIESGTWHKEQEYPVDENYDQFRFVKTHLLPGELIPTDRTIPAIYLVRDGRDAVVSIAHHRKDLVVPGSNFDTNLLEAIIAEEGSFFGGWSQNAAEWIDRADIIIRYEDLIADPAKVFERVEKLINLPQPNWNNLPTFEQMKAGKPMYGGITKRENPKHDPDEFANKFFRKGKSGGWKEEMEPHIQDLFWNYHGNMMERLGFETYKKSVGQNPVLDYKIMQKMGLIPPPTSKTKYHISIEANKVIEHNNDGIKRYIEQMIKCFQDVEKNGETCWDFKLFIESKTVPLHNYKEAIKEENIERFHPYEKKLLGVKESIHSVLPEKIYQTGSFIYKKSGIRPALDFLRELATTKKLKALYQKNLAERNSIHLVHIPLPQNSVYFKSLNYPFLVTVHDMTHDLFPEYHEIHNISLAESGMRFIEAKKADVIAVSQNTLTDLILSKSVPPEKLHLVYEAPDPTLFKWNLNKKLAEKIRKRYKLGVKPYFLCLSTIEPRKNLPNTIRAFNLFMEENPDADVNLVVSGNFGWKTEHLSEELHLDNPHILFTGYVEDEDLHVIYSEAIALCYVSFYEGFGLPPLEAMSCRTPVIYGNNSSMKEVIGEAGLAADANDINSIKEQIACMYNDPALRNKLAIISHHRSFEFSWRKSTYDLLNVYRNIILKK